MCYVSYVGDDYRDNFPKRWPHIVPQVPPWTEDPWKTVPVVPVTQEDLQKLKEEIEALKNMLKAAKIYDEKTGQKDCEMENKIEFIRQIADMVGVSMDDVFPRT